MSNAVYLDTAHWINLAEGRTDRAPFERAVEKGQISPALSFIHVLELANQAEDSRRRVAKYIDHVSSLGKMHWVRGLRQVIEQEALSALERYLKVSDRRVSVFGDHLVDVLARRIGLLAAAEARTYRVEKMAEMVAGLETANEHREFRRRFPRARAVVRRARAGRIRFTPEEKINWLVSLLPEYVLLHNGIQFPITDELRKGFSRTVNLSECPAFTMKLAFHEGWNLSQGGEAASDLEDHYHIVG